jgi:uncharacterized protein
MLFPRSENALSEVIDLYEGFQVELPYFSIPSIMKETPVRLLPVIETDLSPWRLLFNPNTAIWCLLEREETPVVSALGTCRTFSELAASTAFPIFRLRRLITNLYRLGLVEIDGNNGLDQSLFQRGPLFGKRYNIELMVTERCNLACSYCFAEANPKGRQMDLEIGFETIDRALELDASSVWLKFDGGEALMDFEHFRRLVNYARDRSRGMGKRHELGIQLSTNGFFLDPQKADFLAEQGVRVHLSLDGPPELHDRTRPTTQGKASYPAATQALTLLQERGIDYMIIGVVSRQNWDRAIEVAEHLTCLGVESVRLNPVYLAGRGRGMDVAISAEQYFHFLSEILDFLANKRAFREENLAAMARNLVVRTRDYRCMRSPCAAGYDHLAIDPSGDVYPCGAFRLAVPESRLGRLVDLTSLDGAYLNNELLQQMANRIVANIPECSDCNWRHLCEGGCSLDAYANQGGLMKPCSLCDLYKQMYPKLLATLTRQPALLNLLVPEALWCHA